MRKAQLERNTNETQIELEINLDGTGKVEIQTGIGFFDHMLTLLAFHSEMDIKMICHGDFKADIEGGDGDESKSGTKNVPDEPEGVPGAS